MSIRFSKYVRIISGVGGAAGVRRRDLIGRLISQSPLVDPASVLEFADASAVGEFFGFTSPEYLRAAFYFGYVSPAISSPRRISFSRYAPTGAAASVWGGGPVATLANLKLAVAGILSFDFGAGPVTVSGIDLSAAATLADVATKLSTALNANADPHLSDCIVTYDNVAAQFNFSAGVIDGAPVKVLPAGSGVSDLRTALGWSEAQGALYTSGSVAQSAVDAFNASADVSNNFGSFAYIDALTLADVVAVAAANAAQNVMYQYMVAPTNVADALTWSAALIGYAGTAITLSPRSDEYPELIPMAQLAATDYDAVNSTVNYMFKQFAGVTPSVTTDAVSDQLDAARVNYYGQTQTAGQSLSFYQRGTLTGGPTAPIDMNVYANEQWLKDAIGSSLMSLLLSAGRVPANAEGRGQVLAVLQDGIDAALRNGVISVGKALTVAQKLFVTQQTNDPLAWHQVQDGGYWVDATIVPYTTSSGAQEYKAVYQLIYSKDDAIRSIEGTHSLV